MTRQAPLPDTFQTCVQTWPDKAQKAFSSIREIVLSVATRAEIGPLDETLKWGQPAWRPQRARTGSTLRCSWGANHPERISLYVNCNTTLADRLRSLHPNAFAFEGQRALHLPLNSALPEDAIDHCAFLTLTYHRKPA